MKPRRMLTSIALIAAIVFNLLPTAPAQAAVVNDGGAAVAAGTNHSLAVKEDGTVYAWGYNSSGQLGNGTKVSSATRIQTSIANVIAISAGATHSVALKNDGTVWAWGNNSSGKLGDGSTTLRVTPVAVKGLTGVTKIAAGLNHTLALKNDGTVWGWGQNTYGKLGDGTTTYSKVPVKAAGLTDIVAITGGSNHSLAVDRSGNVWAWGFNSAGQLGTGDKTNRLVPTKLTTINNVIAISTGASHTVALKNDGTVWTWGNNSSGKLGNGTTIASLTPVQTTGLTNVIAIAAGQNHNLAVKADGTVWAWGVNSSGQLGDGTTSYRKIPTQIAALTGITAIAAGSNHSLAVKADGTVWGWGLNTYGKLGNATTVTQKVPVQVKGLLVNVDNPSIEEDTNPIIVDETPSTDPEEPVDPTEPVDPVDPIDPVDPVTPADTTAPVTTVQAPSGWQLQDVTLALTATDDASGVLVTHYAIDGQPYQAGNFAAITNEGIHNVSYYSEDQAGNIEAAQTVMIMLDKSAPVTSASYNTQWQNHDVNVTLTAADLYSGAAHTYYSINGSAFVEGTSLNVSDNGVTDIAYYSVDAAGNVEAMKSISVTVDRTAPVTIATASSEWSAQGAKVELTAVDEASGVAHTYYAINGSDYKEGSSLTVAANGISEVSYYSVDRAGNIEQAQSITVKVDLHSPETTAEASQQWSADGVDVALSASDLDSGVAGTYYAVNGGAYMEGTSLRVTEEGISQVTFYSIDMAGNTESMKTVTVKIDRTAPVTTAEAALSWTKQDAVVNLTAADSASGVARTFYSVNGEPFEEGTSLLVTAEGANEISYYSVDQAGNVEDVKTIRVSIDRTAPVTAAQANKGWTSGDVDVKLTAVDGASGVAKTFYSVNGAPFVEGNTLKVTAEGSNEVQFYSVDEAGNTEEVQSIIIQIDKTAPVTMVSKPEGWSVSNVTLQLTASDEASGIAKTYYAIDGGAYQLGSSVIVSAEGIHEVSYYSIDKAGNVEEAQSVGVSIDKTAPATTSNVASGLYNKDVTVQLTSTDAASGVAKTYYAIDGADYTEGTSFIVTEGKHNITFYSLDAAGNKETVKSLAVTVDKSAPVITWDIQSEYPMGAVIPLNYKAADDAAGIKSQTLTLTYNGNAVKTSGDSVKLLIPGTYKAVVTVTDLAGWTTKLEKTIIVYIPVTFEVTPKVINLNDGVFTLRIALPAGYTNLVDLEQITLNGVSGTKVGNGQIKFDRNDFNWTAGKVQVEFRAWVKGYLIIGKGTVEVKQK